ncbi:MAG: GNAT family N-acetyltransferase [Dehalococcoidia bacterium]|nr:GNAT family N-acetyltransferase [Dehalococcoidia bacterium]
MLTGKLVRLRARAMTDLDNSLRWINDPEVTRFLGGQTRYPFSREQEEAWLTAAVLRTHPPEISLSIDTLAGSRHIGGIGLHKVSPEDRKAELGIMIGEQDCWGLGYGTDAIRTLLRFAFDEINLNRIELQVHDDNARAIACYLKCGFVEEGRLRQDRYKDGAYYDTLVMGILASEFRAP